MGALALLAGCSTPNPNACPYSAILADTDHATVMRPGAPADPSGELYRVALFNATTECTLDRRKGETDSSLNLTFRAERAPSADGATYSVPYFVAVTMAARVVNKRLYTARFSFAPGASVATFTLSPDDVQIHLGNGHLPWDYQLTAGLQLTSAQIAYNQKMGRYAP
ncbi:MAG TPA: hypothetical protein VHV26_08840 [Rhizomicrobium sp.]|nr:hypothetical protein [Rhizomicrobium sp.]